MGEPDVHTPWNIAEGPNSPSPESPNQEDVAAALQSVEL